MGGMASLITSLTIVYSTVYSDADQRKHQSSASLAFVWGSHRGPVNSPHKWPVTRKMFPFDEVIMVTEFYHLDVDWLMLLTTICLCSKFRNVPYERWHVKCNNSKLKHWGRDKIAAISQTPLWNTFASIISENVTISIEISLKFLPKGPINNISALFLIMAWRRPGDKPLSEPMLFSLLTHICVTRPQWVKT